jgi:hypothetical protein
LVCGKSDLSGKTTLIGSLLCRKEFYKDDFKPEDIFIVSPSATSDEKWKNIIKFLKIPSSNIFDDYNEEVMTTLYDYLKDMYEESVEDKKIPSHKLIVFDDLGFSSKLHTNKSQTIQKIANNGRHYLISCIMINQYYVQANPNFRSNISGLIAFSATHKQIEAIADEHSTLGKKQDFIKKFQDATKNKHSFFTVNYSNDPDKRYIHNFDEYIEF